ncbi:MAG TPA: hypothetical protein ENJ54_04355 [Chloroflexi bacterium]|nr:hypothetical protein [Chloroflexota bacterium]
MRRLTALLVLFAAALLLAACAAPAPTPAPAALPSPTPQPTATPQPLTATPTPTATPSPTPLPAGLGDLLGQLRAAWSTNPTYAPATAEQVTQLAKDLGIEPAKLGQVYRVEAGNGAVFWASAETGQTYAIRQVPDASKMENLQGLLGLENTQKAVKGGEEVLAVKEVAELERWGKVVRGEDGHWWQWDEKKGAWEKVPYSGFDPEVRVEVVERFLTLKGYTNVEEAVTDFIENHGGKYYVDFGLRQHDVDTFDKAHFVGFAFARPMNMGTGWLRVEMDGGKEVDALAIFAGFPVRDRSRVRTGEPRLMVVPVVIGFYDENGRWWDTVGRLYGMSNAAVLDSKGVIGGWETGYHLPIDDPSKMEALFDNPKNVGKKMYMDDVSIVYLPWLEGKQPETDRQPSKGMREWFENLKKSWWYKLSTDKQVMQAEVGKNPLRELATGEKEEWEETPAVIPVMLTFDGDGEDPWDYSVLKK